MQKKQKTSLVWFRNDLRVNDQASLYQAAKESEQVIALYCFDPRHFAETQFGFKKTEKFRAQFLIETVHELRRNLEQNHIALLVFHEKPEKVIPKLISDYNIEAIYLQKEWTSEETAVTDVLKNELKHIVWHEYYDQFLFHPDDIPYSEFKKIPEVFTEFRKQCEKTVSVKSRLETPKLPDTNIVENSTVIPTRWLTE